MGKRILLGALLGSVIVFLVSAVWHMLTPFGEVGVKALPDEAALLGAMRASIHEAGLYIFPYFKPSENANKEQRQAEDAAAMEKYRRGPTGILVYKPGGQEFRFGHLLLKQYLFGLAAALIAAWVLAIAAGTAGAPTYGTRFWLVLLMALFGGIVYDLPLWNWYGFPGDYICSEIGGFLLSWGAGGLAMAAIVKRPAAA